MRKITQFAIDYPVTIFMFVMAVVLIGYISFQKLGIDLFPNLSNPKLYIEIDAGERPPREIENLFVKNIEAQAIRQSDATEVSSVIQVGSALITVTYTWDKDMDEAFLDLQKALESYMQNQDITELTISQYDPNASPVMIAAMVNDSVTDLNEVRKLAENYVRNKLVRLDGIADVVLVGEEIDEVVIETNPYKLNAFGLTPAGVASQIISYNQNVSGGSIEEQGTKYSIKGLSMIASPDDLNGIIVGFAEEQTTNDQTQSDVAEQIPVYLSDIATVSIKKKDASSIVRLNGKKCLGLSIYKEPGFNTTNAVTQLNSGFDELQKALPGYKFIMVKNQGKFISASINEVKESGLIGILLAILVLLFFLRRISTTLVISIAIPISIIATFTLMYFKGLTLNIMTLGGLTLGAGMLVDNAIIVMENIYRHLERGASVIQAAVKGTAEVGGAITASTLTTIVVFLPIVYMHGASGELFKDQAWTVAFSLLSSLVVAILVIPVLVTKIFPRQKASTSYKSIGFSWYPALLAKILNKRYWVIGGTVVLMVGTYMLLPFIGSEFMPQSKSDSFTIEITLPEGTSLTRTSETIQQIEEMIESGLPDYVSAVYSQIGTTGNSSIASLLTYENKASVFIRLTNIGYRHYDEVIAVLDNMLEKNEDLVFSFMQDETSLQSLIGNNEAPIVVEVIGEDIDQIMELTEQTKNIVAQNLALFNVKSSVENGAPEINVRIDRVRAGLWGVTVDQVVTQLQNSLQGLDVGEFDQLGEMISITIKQPNVSINQLENIEIKSGTKSYRLTDLASIEFNTMPKEILRRNQSRIGKVTAYMNDSKPFDHVVQELNSKLSFINLPANYKIKVTGEEEKRAESMANLTFALLLSIVLVYMVMASQFESLIHPFTILLTIPMALVGTILTFAFIGSPFNIMAYIGMIMLVGIAVNDSIILVDAINQLKAAGVNKREAILQAGQQRIRPIIMTSLTTVLALIPLTIGFGESASLRSPMAWAVIGGLVTSTLLTLVVIPCVYWVFDRNKQMSMSNQ